MVQTREPRYVINGASASEIVESVEAGIAGGALPPGSALPPVRTLAAGLGVNPNTVAAAYRALRDRGSIVTDGRRGSSVRARPDAGLGRPGIADAPLPPGTRDLTGGAPSAALLPHISVRGLARPPLYNTELVHPRLARLAAARFAADGVPADELLVTAGALDAVERILRTRLRPGDAVIIEDPGWHQLTDLVATHALTSVPVPVDDEGLDPQALADALRRRPRALITVPRAQNPTGACVTAGRARELREVLAGHPDLLVIEDDHCADLVSAPAHPLAGATRYWAYVRSVSKAYGPDLRTATVACDATTAAQARGQQRHGARWVSHLLQTALADLWENPDVSALVTAAGRIYDKRRETLLRALAERAVEAHGRTGLNMWIPVADEAAAIASLLGRGYLVAAGAPFRAKSRPAMRITISDLEPDEAPDLADAIAVAVAARSRAVV